MKIAKVLKNAEYRTNRPIKYMEELLPSTNKGPVDNKFLKNENSFKFPFYQPFFEWSLIFRENLVKKSKYSNNSEVSLIEHKLAEKGINVRFKNNLETAKFIQKGLEDIEKVGYDIPKNILIVHPMAIAGAGGATTIFRDKLIDKAPVLFPQTIVDLSHKKIAQKYKLGIYSTDNILKYVYHEVGHWLHFQNKPDLQLCKQIWKTVDKDIIGKQVSLEALKLDDGTEFVAEVFAGMIDGKKYSKYIMDIYKQLKGPLK